MPALGAKRRPEDGFERTLNRRFLGRDYRQDTMPGPAQAIQAGMLPVRQIGKHCAALPRMHRIFKDG